MKICVLAWSVYETDARVRKYSEALAERGDVVDVICLSPRNRKIISEKYDLNGVTVYEVDKRFQEKGIFDYLIAFIKFFFISFYYTTKLHIRKRYDVIHVHSLPDFEVFAALIPKLSGAKVILDIHDPVPDLFALKFGGTKNTIFFKILKLLELISSKFADHVITVTDYWMKVIGERSHIPDGKISVILNLPDTRLFNTKQIGNNNKPNEYFTLIYTGTLNKHCGLDSALKAINIVKDEIPSIRFLIYGEGIELNKLQSMVSELGLEDFVSFHNFIPLQGIPELMSHADAGIASLCGYDEYTQEGLTIKLFEYLAMGLPAIGTRTNATKYYLGEESALLTKPNDYKDVARCIKELYRNPEKRHQLRNNGLDYISRNNWKSQMGGFFMIVDKLVSSKRK